MAANLPSVLKKTGHSKDCVLYCEGFVKGKLALLLGTANWNGVFWWAQTYLPNLLTGWSRYMPLEEDQQISLIKKNFMRERALLNS